MALSQLRDQLGLLDRDGSENHPVQSTGQQLFRPFQRTHAPSQLHRDIQSRRDGAHRRIIHRFSPLGTIEVHQVQSAGPLLLPAAGLGDRVLAEAGHLVVIPLMQAHTGAVQQIDGGDDLHARQPSAHHPAGPRVNSSALQ